MITPLLTAPLSPTIQSLPDRAAPPVQARVGRVKDLVPTCFLCSGGGRLTDASDLVMAAKSARPDLEGAGARECHNIAGLRLLLEVAITKVMVKACCNPTGHS